MLIIKDKLKIKILQNNKEVLPIIVNDVSKDLKPNEDIALIRFDAYADFLVPRDIHADEIESLNHLVDSIDNQSWILPAVYRGFIKKIVWFKPPWGHQFQDGVYQIRVGKCQQTGLLKIASSIPYFTSNCVYSSSDNLSNIRIVDIYISTSGLANNYATAIENNSTAPIYDNEDGSESLDSDSKKKLKSDSNHKDSQLTTGGIYSINATLLNQLIENTQYLIDINVSFFSTDDPIRKQFDENEYEILRYVYTRIVQERSDAEILQYITARQAALEQIRISMNEYLTDPKQDQTINIDNIYLSGLISVIRYKKLNWKKIHSYGMHLSDTRPPSHVSSEGMIIYLIEAISKVLESIKKRPILVTIARCDDDGYCSIEQADLIQSHLEKKLLKTYKIDEIVGKSLSKTLASDDDEDNNDGETNDKEKIEKKGNGERSDTISFPMETNTSKTDINLTSSMSSNANNQSSNSPSKSALSPGEIKAASPSSLSEGSPLSN